MTSPTDAPIHSPTRSSASATPAAGITEFDARPLLAQGIEPLTEILALSESLRDGDQLHVLAPFEPAPLYPVMRGRGFLVHQGVMQEDGRTWRTPFTRVHFTATQRIADILERHPATRDVFAIYGLDTCCGAQRTLREASDAHGVSLPDLIHALRDAAVR
jgi:hypothetical protein